MTPLTLTSPEVFQEGPPVDNFTGVTVPSPGTFTGTAGPNDIIEQSKAPAGGVEKIILELEKCVLDINSSLTYYKVQINSGFEIELRFCKKNDNQSIK